MEKQEIILPPEKENKIVTTQEEMECFYIVKAILCEKLSGERIYMRDTMSYCNILLDDNKIIRFI